MFPEVFSLEGRSAIVTGGSRGIGRAVARAFAEAGADVTIANRDEADGREAAASIREATGATVRARPADVTDEAAVEALVADTVEAAGGVDVLVNNAGITHHAPAEEMSVEAFRRVLDTNLVGTFRCTRHAGRAMIDGDGGAVVNLSSMSARVANYPQRQVAYNASKAAIEGFTRQLASEWAEHGIRVNALAPGYVRTEPVDEALSEDPELEALWTDETLLDRLARPEEVAPLAVVLASDAASYVTGATLLADGGYTVR